VKCILNALKWQYTADDQKSLVILNLFTKLNGLGQKESFIYQKWGTSLFNIRNNRTLASDLLETFEFVIFCLLKRAITEVDKEARCKHFILFSIS
jgi:hypothetical protein